jgi:hypothetical protein
VQKNAAHNLLLPSVPGDWATRNYDFTSPYTRFNETKKSKEDTTMKDKAF